MIIVYAVARREKPKERAKVAGRPWSVTISLGASEGRAFRARRSSQERRQCARLARVKICDVCGGSGESTKVSPLVKPTVSLRSSLSHSLRMRQRGQSFHTIGARGSGWDASEVECPQKVQTTMTVTRSVFQLSNSSGSAVAVYFAKIETL